MVGFFSRGTREGAHRKKTQSVESKNCEKESGDKQGYALYLFGLLGDEVLPLLFPPSLDVGRHCSASVATCFRVASPVSKTVTLPSLDLHKTNGKSVQYQT